MNRRATFNSRSPRSRVAALLVLVAICTSAQAATPLRITELNAGFDGRFKVGCWAPFEVTLEGGAAPVSGYVEMTVADGDGVPSRVHAPPQRPITIAAGETISVRLFAKIGQLDSGVTVDFRTADGPVVSRRFEPGQSGPLSGIVPSATQLIVTLGGPLASLDAAHFEPRNTIVALLKNVGQMPTEWWGFEGVDAVVLATADDEISDQLSTLSPQMAALELWVRMGGTLVLSVGRNAEKVLASTSPLAALAPGSFGAMVARLPATALETYAETSEPFDSAGVSFLADVPKLIDVRGRIQAYAGAGPRDLPLVVRTAHGFGEVVFVAFDLDRPPVAAWSAQAQLVDKLLGHATQGPSETDDDTLGEVTTLGFTDLSGQLRGALDQFDGVRIVPFWLVALLAVVYIVCIGPLDYFLVRRVLGRMEATWFTFALSVVAFSAGAYFLAYGLKGRELRVNRVELVDFDASTGAVRGTSWASLFSPATAAYDLSIDPAGVVADPTAPPRTLFSWMGLPGDGFGGMNPATASVPLFTLPYDFSGRLDTLNRVPIAVWSSKPFVGRWWAAGPGPITAELTDNGRLGGTLVCNLDAPLEDCVLIYDTWAYPLHTLLPGQRIDVATEFDPQTVETYLRRVRVVGDRDVPRPYDQASFDIPRIVEVMSCYELAGGQRYTGLANEYQEFVDLSQLVRNGRAILLGRRPASATKLIRDGQPVLDRQGQHWTIVRFVFQVTQTDGS